MDASTLRDTAKKVRKCALATGNKQWFVNDCETSRGSALPLNGSLAVLCDQAITVRAPMQGVRYRIVVPGDKDGGKTVYIGNVARGTNPEAVREALALAMEFLATNPQLAMHTIFVS